MSNSTFNVFHSPERNVLKNSLTNQGPNAIGMLNPTKVLSNLNFPSKSFTPAAPKPKGLSIRSQSDLNISSSAKSGSSVKPNEAKKVLSTPQADKVSKIIRQKQKQGLSPNSKSPHATVTSVFKRPVTPKVEKKVYPEPEKLAGYFDYEENFDRVIMRSRSLDKEAKVLSEAICKRDNFIKPYKDNFKPHSTSVVDCLPSHTTSNENLALPDVEIPSLSDDDY